MHQKSEVELDKYIWNWKVWVGERNIDCKHPVIYPVKPALVKQPDFVSLNGKKQVAFVDLENLFSCTFL